MLKGTRQFVPEITRSGGRPSKVQFTIRCSECSDAATFESKGLVSDGAVSHWFRQKGWLLGRNSRSFDICPACLGLADGMRPAQRRAASGAGTRTFSSAKTVEKGSPMSKPKDDTERLIARHFGKPPQTKAHPTPSSPADRGRDMDRERSLAGSSSKQPPEFDGPATPSRDDRLLERFVASIASDIESMRAAVVQMVEQMGRIVSSQMEQTNLHKEAIAAQRQQIEAVARLAPLLVRSAEGVSGSVREAIAGIQTLAHASGVPKAAPTSAGDLSISVEQATDQGPALDRPDALVIAKRPRGRPRKNPLPAIAAADVAPVPVPASVKRPRGRPRKHPVSEDGTGLQVPHAASAHPAAAPASAGPAFDGAIVTKRPRGRPRKLPRAGDMALQSPGPVVRRPRGRPRKNPAPEPTAQRAAPDAAPVRGTTGDGGEARISWEKKAWSRHASVTSQPDRSSLTKFTTVIQMKRKDWDLSGFRPEDGLTIERRRNEVMITRAGSGGVRATKVGATRVEVRAKTLGNLNFNKVKLEANEDTIVLKGSRI